MSSTSSSIRSFPFSSAETTQKAAEKKTTTVAGSIRKPFQRLQINNSNNQKAAVGAGPEKTTTSQFSTMTATHQLRSPLSTHNRRRAMPSASTPAMPDSPTQSKSLLSSTKSKNLVAMAPLMNPLFMENTRDKADYSSTSENRTLPETTSAFIHAPSAAAAVVPVPSIFQRSSSSLDQERSSSPDDMWSLKRANPVFDSDDEDDELAIYASPSKRRFVCLDSDDEDEPLLVWGSSPGRAHSADRFLLQDDVREE